MKHCVVVPVYKEIPDDFEIMSFIQLVKTLSNHPIYLITHNELNLKLYCDIALHNNTEIKIIYFKKKFFNSLLGYNQLCLSPILYRTFENYDYMLIYQLDAYVFSDRLDEWCNKGYDYIGAPWFEDNKSHQTGAKLWAVGNGGFSLRKIATFIELFESKKRAYTFKYLYKKTIRENKGIMWLLKAWALKHENNFNYLLNSWNDAEDLFYCLKLVDTNFRLNIPTIDTAINFAFEQSPAYLCNLNGNKLPFGCHAWEKYEYETFWKKYL